MESKQSNQSKLSSAELIEYATLSAKAKKNKYIGIKLTEIEFNRYNELAEKHGVGASTLMRETLLKSLFHFKGIAHK